MAAKKAIGEGTKPSCTFDVKVAPEGEDFAVRVPFEVRELFGRARPPVVVDLDGYRFRSTVAAYGGEYFIGIRRSHREAAGLVPGKSVSITLTLDDAPRDIEPPPDLAAALKTNAAAKAVWDGLASLTNASTWRRSKRRNGPRRAPVASRARSTCSSPCPLARRRPA